MGEHTGAIWLRTGDTASAEDLYRLLRQHYALDATTPPEAVIQRVQNEGGLLVVIDNAEAIPDPARADFQQAADRLANAGAAVLVTTRVADWSIPRKKRTLEPSKLEPDAAARVVGAMADELGIEANTAPFAETLAQAAKLHPRLIELAVGKLDYEPVSEILKELQGLSHDTDDALKEMIGKTVAQMAAHDPDAPGVLRRLAVTRGGFTWDAAQAISGLDDEALRARLKTLIDYRFVRFKADRYDIDDLVGLAVGEDEDAHRPHYDYYKALADQHDDSQDYYGLDVESANLEAAFEWAMQNDAEAALWLFNAGMHFLSNRGRFTQRLDWIERVVKALKDSSDDLRANAQNSLGYSLSGIILSASAARTCAGRWRRISRRWFIARRSPPRSITPRPRTIWATPTPTSPRWKTERGISSGRWTPIRRRWFIARRSPPRSITPRPRTIWASPTATSPRWKTGKATCAGRWMPIRRR